MVLEHLLDEEVIKSDTLCPSDHPHATRMT
jgi:hypothetical protein